MYNADFRETKLVQFFWETMNWHGTNFRLASIIKTISCTKATPEWKQTRIYSKSSLTLTENLPPSDLPYFIRLRTFAFLLLDKLIKLFLGPLISSYTYVTHPPRNSTREIIQTFRARVSIYWLHLCRGFKHEPFRDTLPRNPKLRSTFLYIYTWTSHHFGSRPNT